MQIPSNHSSTFDSRVRCQIKTATSHLAVFTIFNDHAFVLLATLKYPLLVFENILKSDSWVL